MLDLAYERGILRDPQVLDALLERAAIGVEMGIALSGPEHAQTLHDALALPAPHERITSSQTCGPPRLALVTMRDVLLIPGAKSAMCTGRPEMR